MSEYPPPTVDCTHGANGSWNPECPVCVTGGDDESLPQSSSRLEAEIHRFQYAQVRRLYGREAAEKANYGWAVDGSADGISVSTKVYAPSMVLTTTVSTTLVDWEPGGWR